MTGPAAQELALAEGLRQAHRQVAALDAEPAVKQRARQRLLAISDAAKRDTSRAAARLEQFLQDLSTGRLAASEQPEPPA